MRVVGYAVGSALAAGASVLLLRHLGVADFGRYVTVISLVAIVTGLTDVGLTLVGEREYVLRQTDEERRELIGIILGVRFVATPAAVALAVLFAVGAGYGSTLTIGTILVGSSVVFANVALTLAIPFTTQLRLGALTATEVARQFVAVCGNALLVVVGAHLLAFFAVPLAAAVVASGLAVALAGVRFLSRPIFSWGHWLPILRESAPMAASVIVAVLYLRTLVVMASLLTSHFQTGLFATSYRVLEILAALPALMVGSAFPIIARAGAEDEERLRGVLQRMLEATLLFGTLVVVVLAIAAEPIVRILGGSAYTPAAGVLRIQSFALLGSFASVIWTTALIALRRQSALIVVNGAAMLFVVGLGAALIPLWGATGAAAAAVAGEALLALAALWMLVRTRPSLRPDPRFVARLAAAGAAAALCVLIPGLPTLGTAVVAAVVYVATAFVVKAVPPEALEAFVPSRARP